ncbi:MAG TPA: IPT/TIG domain-containing protein [Puia sp.]|nr:IPT/TIG domain-containing protein [Puia sp.]
MLTIRNAITRPLLATLALAACSKHSTPPTPTHPAPPALSISSFSPSNGPDSTAVTITGADFNSTAADDSVYFNGKPARVVSATDSTLVAIVPELAGTGNVVVKANGSIVTGNTFTYDTSYHVSIFVDNLPVPTFYLALDTSGNLYVSDRNIGTVYKYSPTGVLDTTMSFLATGLAIDDSNNLFMAVGSNIMKIGRGDTVTTIATDNGFPLGLALDPLGNLYVGNASNNSVDKITPNGQVTNIATGLFSPSGVAVGPNGYVYTVNYSVNAYNNADGEVTAISPAGVTSSLGAIRYGGYQGLWISGNNDIYVTVFNQQFATGWLEKISASGTIDTLASPNLNFPCGIIRDRNGNFFVAQSQDGPTSTSASVVKMTPY